MNPFTLLTPDTVEDAIRLFGQHSETARYIAGGTDVIVKIKEGWMAPSYLISLKGIPGLSELIKNETTGELGIGAMVTHAALESSVTIRTEYPIIHDAVSNVGSLQVRNMGTIGGNLINAVPSADGAIPMIALDGRALIRGPQGERSVDVKDLFVEPYKTVLTPGEILTQITLPARLPRTGSAYIKFGRRAAMELPLIGIGVLLALDTDRQTCVRARICLGVAGPTPLRAVAAEALLEGEKITDALLKQAGETAAGESQVRDSVRGQAWHRKEMIAVHVPRMGQRCLEIINRNQQEVS